MTVKGFFVLSLGLATGACLASPLPAHAAKTASQGIYTSAQATQGQKLYTEKCAMCHGESLTGGSAPALKGKPFMSSWSGRSVGALYNKIKNTMPASNPGSLSAQQAATAVAFILKSNNFPAGSSALPTNAQTLEQMHIGQPK